MRANHIKKYVSIGPAKNSSVHHLAVISDYGRYRFAYTPAQAMLQSRILAEWARGKLAIKVSINHTVNLVHTRPYLLILLSVINCVLYLFIYFLLVTEHVKFYIHASGAL